jgi:hypothetical protein
MAKTAITKIVVKMGDREQTLTVEQARELQEALNTLFGGPKEIVKTIPYPVYQRPFWPYREPYYITWTAPRIGDYPNSPLPYSITCRSGNLNDLKANTGYMKYLNSGTVELKLSDG